MRVLYIDIDSLRSDHLGCNGYSRPTSPVIDALAAKGTTLTACHTSDAPCVPSRAALFSGRFGINNGVVAHDGPANHFRYPGSSGNEDMHHPMWMRLLQRHGWETVSFSGFGQRHTCWWYGAGFTQNHTCAMPGGHESAAQVSERINQWLRANGTQDNWFLHATLWDVHTPYNTISDAEVQAMRALPSPDAPDAAMVERDIERWWGQETPLYWWSGSDDFRNPGRPQTAAMPEGNIESYEDYLDFLAAYDASILYADRHIGHVLEELDRLGVLEDTAVIISADHGEAIGDLGVYFEHPNSTHGVSHVPLVMHWPGRTDGAGPIDELCYQIDLPATVADLAGIEVPAGWDGRSLAPLLAGDASQARDHLVVGTGLGSYQRAVITREHRLVRTIHPGGFPYAPLYLFGSGNGYRDELDVAEHADVVARLDHLLSAWHAEQTSWPRYSADPFALQAAAGVRPDWGSTENLARRMRALGRADHLAQLAAFNPTGEHELWSASYEIEDNPDAQEVRL